MSAEPVFVFGSNRAGRHGKGAALFALHHRGAVYGQGEGMQGNSYAIPTKGERLDVLSLYEIAEGVNRFKQFAADHPELSFRVTAIGTGLAGYHAAEIAPMFDGSPKNVELPEVFMKELRF